ncbi:StbB family protein [Yersinia ruckeri]|uniref:StbB family protein n=1 Tax=Yersinia ruckeri TaxID=29486 RepID=UPI00223748AC|nr:StbB family protein [Yersinia ruckeri]MCW6572935.1 transcriptional regulator [Yersinia ruckeri]HDL7537477.1 transcriptional regulator [Yersinia enterocolitica]
MFIKIAVVNNSGNVGKSTICDVLLKPRIEGAEVIRVESINFDGNDEEKISAREFNDILKKIDVSDSAIIDVGSSNIETFINQMEAYKDSQEDIDYFLIPVTPHHKQQIDSVATVGNLIDLGVDADRIKFVFNQVEKAIPLERQFSDFFSGIKSFKNIKIKKHAVVYDTPVFSFLNKSGRGFEEVLHDDRDFRTLLRQTESKEDREKISDAKSIKRIVTGLNEELDVAFSNLEIK